MQALKSIASVEVDNVKGVSNRKFELNLLPNKPTLVVAPNGFGKSSLAASLGSLRGTRLEVSEDHRHNGDANLKPSLKVTYILDDGTTHTKIADETKNEIFGVLKVDVINSQLVAKAQLMRVQGQSIAKPSMQVTPITLIDKIPDKPANTYKHSVAKQGFGSNGKVLPNMGAILADARLMAVIGDVDFSKAGQVGNQKKVADFKSVINLLLGTADKVLSAVSEQQKQEVRTVPHVDDICSALTACGVKGLNETELCLVAIQMGELRLGYPDNFRALVKYRRYELEKAAYEAELAPFRATWKSIAPKEEKGRLVITFPKANQISNGERDTLAFVALLLKSRRKLSGNCALLVIDEIFDYLDDANLVACQYHLTKMISKWKASGQQIFTMILTHIDPGYFKNFTFKDQKIVYLASTSKIFDKNVQNIILRRDEALISDQLAKHFLHHSDLEADLTAEFAQIGLAAQLAKASDFRAHVGKQLDLYLAAKNYDPVSVCCAVRNLIESKAYQLIEQVDRPGFLATHKTTEKLRYAAEKGADLPDTYFLLSIIYNEAVHLKKHQDNMTPLICKLDNLTVRSMIAECAA